MDDIKVSVIIPVYNVEKYLEKCLSTVINQTLKEIEIICINDGSSDNSFNILEKYSEKDNRIFIINNKENRGGGFSRNEGLEIAKGEYVSFIDADDWVEEDMLEYVYNESKSKNLDLILFLAKNYDDINERFYETDYYNFKCFDKSFDNRVFCHDEAKNFIFRVAVSPWLKLYKKDLLDKKNLKFPEERVMHDNPFFYNVFLNANRISLIRKYFYYRRRHNASLINMRPKWLSHIVPISNLVVEAFKNNNAFNEYKNAVINRKIFLIRDEYNKMPEKYQKLFFKEIVREFTNIHKNHDKNLEYALNLNQRNLIFYTNILNADSFSEFFILNEISNLKIDLNNFKIKFKLLKKENKFIKKENKNLKSKIEIIESSIICKILKNIKKSINFFRK